MLDPTDSAILTLVRARDVADRGKVLLDSLPAGLWRKDERPAGRLTEEAAMLTSQEDENPGGDSEECQERV